MVDLERSKSVNDDVYWQFQKVQVSTDYPECFNTSPVPVHLFDVGVCMGMAWMLLTDRATCSGPVGDRMGTSGSWQIL